MLCAAVKNGNFIKEQEASRLLSSLGLKTPLSKIPALGDILSHRYKLNELITKFLFAGDRLMPEMHLK